jgi:acyl carrier protein
MEHALMLSDMEDEARAGLELAITRWLANYLAELLDIEESDVDETARFDRYGLDSSATVGMAGDLGAWLGHDIDAALPYDYPSIAALAGALAGDRQTLQAFARRQSAGETMMAAQR